MTNRLKLNFSLSTNAERKAFLDEYLKQEMFVKDAPTEEELNTMADYLLWGKDPSTGKNGKQSGLELKTRHGTWDKSPLESLEQLLEQPTFNEASLHELGTTVFRTKKEVFSREDALANASPTVRESFLNLFSLIDEIELLCSLYDERHGKRTKPIRSSLLNKFSEEKLSAMREKIAHWNQYHYLKMRHQLVEMRREQYTLRDSYRKTMFSQEDDSYAEPETYDFDAGIEVLPLGLLHDDNPTSLLIFRAWPELIPQNFDQSALNDVSSLYWKKQAFAPSAQQKWIDFRDLEHVYQLLNFLGELRDAEKESNMDSNLSALLNTLQFYVECADLTEIQREILDMKLHKKKNSDIAWDINHKYGKTYTVNYISTIFRQRIIPKINKAAEYHTKVISNIFFEEEFKTCTCCGETMLRDADNFTRKTRAGDGFSSRCKRCEKKIRQNKT